MCRLLEPDPQPMWDRVDVRACWSIEVCILWIILWILSAWPCTPGSRLLTEITWNNLKWLISETCIRDSKHSIHGKRGFSSPSVHVMLECLLSSEMRQLFGTVSSRTTTPTAFHSSTALWICWNNVVVNLWFITMCECVCVGEGRAGITSLFLQTAMLWVLRYAPSSIPFHHMLYLLLSFVTFHNFVSPIFVTKRGSHSDIAPNQCCTTVEHGWELFCSWQ